MKLQVYPVKQSQPLAEDYVQHYSRVERLFDYNPRDLKSWKQRANWLDSHSVDRTSRGPLVDVLYGFNQRMNNSKEALDGILSLKQEKTLAVVGGQQAGLFTGPLLVIHKAVTLIQTARKAAIQLGRPVVPVFWIAGEDHDIDEVNHTYYLDPKQLVHKIKLTQSTELRSSVSQLPIALSAWEEVLSQLDESLIETEFKPDIMNKLSQISKVCSNLVDFFGKIMAWLFGPYGLILVNSDDPLLRQLEIPMLHRMVTENKQINDALLDGKKHVEDIGYQPQAEVAEGNANLFLYHQGERILLHREEGGFADRKGNVFRGTSELADLAKQSPECFSNNVFTRPMMQDFLFPVLCTILGPGEIAYWGLTRSAFHALGMSMPIILPRLQFTLIEGTTHKQMEKFALSFEDVYQRFEDKKKAWLDEQDTLQLEKRFTQVKEQFSESYHPLLELIAGINPGIGKLGETNLQKIIEQIDFLETRAIDAFQSRFDVAIKQLERIRMSIKPLNKPQERMYNIFAYVNKYGYNWLQELIQEDMDNDGSHRVVYL